MGRDIASLKARHLCQLHQCSDRAFLMREKEKLGCTCGMGMRQWDLLFMIQHLMSTIGVGRNTSSREHGNNDFMS